MSIKIVTDTGSDLPAHLAEQHDIHIVPLNVMFDDAVYKDGVDITVEEFNNKLFVEGKLPKTSQPSPADFLNTYEQLLEQGHSIISIHVSSKLSGTYNSAIQASESIAKPSGQEISVIDSLKASIPITLGVLATANHLSANPSITLDELSVFAENTLRKCSVYVALNTLEYLHKGGRIGKASALLGTMLRVKPILSLESGEVVPIAKCRSLTQSLQKMTELIAVEGELQSAAVIYNTDTETKETLKAQLLSIQPNLDLIETTFGPTIGSYVGPNAIGLAALPKSS